MVEVVAAEMGDVGPVADLWVDLAAGQRAFGSHLAARENREAVREAVARHVVTGGLAVARDGEEVVGFVMFSLEEGRFEQDVSRGMVRNIYVRPERRDEGIGTDLLHRAERGLAAAGADVVALEAMADNAAARRFYERAGYRPHRVEFEKPVESDTHSKED